MKYRPRFRVVCVYLTVVGICFAASANLAAADKGASGVPTSIPFCGVNYVLRSQTEVTKASGTFQKDHLPGKLIRYYYEPELGETPKSYLQIYLLTQDQNIKDAYKATLELIGPSIWPRARETPVVSNILYTKTSSGAEVERFYCGDLLVTDFGFNHKGHILYIAKHTILGAMGILYGVDVGRESKLGELRKTKAFIEKSSALIELWPAKETL